MRIRRVRHGQIVWRQKPISGVANSAISVRVLHGRRKPIRWGQKPLAGTVSGAISESATLADSVSAVYSGSVATAESITLSDTDAYPITTFGQTVNRGRNPPIVWRQREAIATGTSLSGSFSDAVALTDATSASQAFASNAVAESFTATDTNAPVGGSSNVSIIEAESVSDSTTEVWSFNVASSESLNVNDANTGTGGSPEEPPRPGGGGGHPHPHPHPWITKKKKPKNEEDDDDPPLVPKKVQPNPKPPKPETKKDNALVDDGAQEQLDKDEEEAIRRLLAQLLA